MVAKIARIVPILHKLLDRKFDHADISSIFREVLSILHEQGLSSVIADEQRAVGSLRTLAPRTGQAAIGLHAGLYMDARCVCIAEFHKLLDRKFDRADIFSILRDVLSIPRGRGFADCHHSLQPRVKRVSAAESEFDAW